MSKMYILCEENDCRNSGHSDGAALSSLTVSFKCWRLDLGLFMLA